MKKISAKSKLGQHFVEAYNRSTKCTLEDAYAKPSAAKQAAFERCQQQCEAEKGDRHFRIINANCQAFTVAFITTTHELRVITRCHDYLVHHGARL